MIKRIGKPKICFFFPDYPYLMEVRQRVDNKVLIIFNARNEHDRTKFCEDLKESVCEMDEMESLRIEGELEKQKASLRASRPNSTTENRDSGVADMELLTTNEKNGTLKSDSTLKRSALSNSLLDIHEAGKLHHDLFAWKSCILYFANIY